MSDVFNAPVDFSPHFFWFARLPRNANICRTWHAVILFDVHSTRDLNRDVCAVWRYLDSYIVVWPWRDVCDDVCLESFVSNDLDVMCILWLAFRWLCLVMRFSLSCVLHNWALSFSRFRIRFVESEDLRRLVARNVNEIDYILTRFLNFIIYCTIDNLKTSLLIILLCRLENFFLFFFTLRGVE